MSATSKIEWTATVNPDGTVTPGKTWNPVRGCSVISPGCVNCYAMKMAHRFSGPGKPYEYLTKLTKAGPQWTGLVRFDNERTLLEPLSWRKPARVFVNSMSDLFHEGIPFEAIDRIFAVMALAPQHTYQILTKRAERMRAYMSQPDIGLRWLVQLNVAPERHRDKWCYQENDADAWTRGGLPNVWLGVSVEDQKHADERIPLLLQAPAAVRFISAEPLLGQVDLCSVRMVCDDGKIGRFSSLHGVIAGGDAPRPETPPLDWVIVGGESGPGARQFSVDWARCLVTQCREAGVPVFVKQLGANPFEPYSDGTRFADLHLKNSKGGDPSEWPEELRVRQFPKVAA